MAYFWDHYKNWLDYLKIHLSYSQKTILAYGSDLKIFIKFLEKYHAESISISLIAQLEQTSMRAFAADLSKRDYEANSRSRIISAIKNFIKYLKRENLISEDFALTIKNPKLKKPLPKALTTHEALALFDSLKINDNNWLEIRDITIFLLLYTAGLRISEVLSLSKSNIHAEHLVIKGKGNKERIAPLLTISKEYLEKYLAILPYPLKFESKIFLGQKGGELNPRIVQRKIADLRKSLNLPENTTPHSLRHSFATELLNKGANLREIQELLGHQTIATTERYTKISTKKLLSSYQKAAKR